MSFHFKIVWQLFVTLRAGKFQVFFDAYLVDLSLVAMQIPVGGESHGTQLALKVPHFGVQVLVHLKLILAIEILFALVALETSDFVVSDHRVTCQVAFFGECFGALVTKM